MRADEKKIQKEEQRNIAKKRRKYSQFIPVRLPDIDTSVLAESYFVCIKVVDIVYFGQHVDSVIVRAYR